MKAKRYSGHTQSKKSARSSSGSSVRHAQKERDGLATERVAVSDEAYDDYRRSRWLFGEGTGRGVGPLLRPAPVEGVGLRSGKGSDYISGRHRKVLEDLLGVNERDVVTRLWSSSRLNASVERALDRVVSGETWALAYLEVPGNLKGLNPKVADAGSNVVMRHMSTQVLATLANVFGAGKVLGFRGKGPGIWVLVEANAGDVEGTLDRVRLKARDDLYGGRSIESIGQPIQWESLVHPSDPKLKGVEILSTVVDLRSTSGHLSGEGPPSARPLLLQVERDFNNRYKSSTSLRPPFESTQLVDAEVFANLGRPRTQATCGRGPLFDNEFDAQRSKLKKRLKAIRRPNTAKRRPTLNAFDPATGALLGVGRLPTLERAVRHVSVHPGSARAFGVLVDIGNLGAIDGVLGRADADAMLKAAVHVLREELEAVGAKVSLFRHGGDEFMAVLTGDVHLTQAACEAACANAKERITELSSRVRFECSDGQTRSAADIPHPKDSENRARDGMSLYFAVKAIEADPTKRPRDVAAGLARTLGVELETVKDRVKNAPSSS